MRPIKVQDVVIPFISAYRPLWLGLGTVAFDLMIALTITSLIRTRISYRSWHAGALELVPVLAGRRAAWPGHRLGHPGDLGARADHRLRRR